MRCASWDVPDTAARAWRDAEGKVHLLASHLVNRAMVEQIRGHADVYVQCVSSRGSPHPIVDSNGNPALNRYYPAPEMHEDAARLLLPACRELLGGHWT